MKTMILMVVLALCLGINAIGQTKLTENTIRIEKDAKGATAKVSDMAWLAGSWKGNALGGVVQEVWNMTDAGVMMGMFSLSVKNKPVFYEFLTFSENDGQLVLKLKHFNPDMSTWEEKNDTVDFRFIKNNGDRFYFNGLTFEKNGDDAFNIYLALRKKDKSVREEVFRMKRSL